MSKITASRAKSLWKQSKRVVDYTDTLTKEESQLLEDNDELKALLVKESEVKAEIVELVDSILNTHRRERAEVLGRKY